MRHNWHEAYLLALGAVAGLSGLLGPDIRARAIESSFPAWGQAGWYGGLLVGSVLGIAGLLLGTGLAPDQAMGLPPDRLRRQVSRQLLGMSLERSAMLLLAGLCVAYVLGAVAVVGLGKASTAIGVAYVAAFALANAARARQIRLVLRRVQARSTDPEGGPG